MSNLLDGVFAVAGIIVLLTCLFVGMYLLDAVKAKNIDDRVNEMADKGLDWMVMFDGLVVFIFFMMVLSILLLAYILPGSTIFAVLFFIILIVQIPIIDILKVYVIELSSSAQFSGYVSYFPMTFLILDNSSVLLVAIAILTALIQFGKGYYGSGEVYR